MAELRPYTEESCGNIEEGALRSAGERKGMAERTLVVCQGS